MNKLVTMLQDDTGNVSMMRVVTGLVVVAVVIPKVWLAIKMGTEVTWSADDMEMLGTVLGAKLIQNTQENTPTTPKV